MTAQLQPVNLVAPGFRGLNLAQQGALLEPSFATVAQNCVIDSAGRLAARNGFLDLTATDITGTPTVKTLFDFRKNDGTTETIIAWDGGIGNDTGDPEANDISGAVTDADGRWWFQNFNDNVYGFQDGQTPIQYTGAGTFTAVVPASGTLPTSARGIGLAAYGRLWALDSDKQTIKYSALLDATRWDAADGGGSIDMSSVWTDGTDEVTAIQAFNGQLVVFGKRHVVFWTDGVGAQLGIQPDNIFVNDVITGTGCLTQWSVQPVGETDLLFLGPNGVQSLIRVLESASNPVRAVSKFVRNNLLSNIQMLTDVDTIRSVYNPLFGFYLLTIPEQVSPAITGITYCFDQRYPFQDDAGEVLNIVTTWTLAPTSWLNRDDSTLYLGGTWGVGAYGDSPTDNGSSFRFIYQSPWLNLGEQFADRLKMLKRIGSILFVRSNTDILFKWNVDFNDASKTITRTVSADAAAEWGSAEWGLAEWSGGLSLRIIKVPARSRGQYFRLAIEAEVDGEFAIQQLELFTKIGRLA